MALDSLKWKLPSEFKHQPKHDLESLFYVIISLCTYVEKPGHLRSPIPLATDPTLCMDEWWAVGNHRDLARTKSIALNNFRSCTLACLPSYWDDFHPVLEKLRAVIWPDSYSVFEQQNQATHQAFWDVLDNARKIYKEKGEDLHVYAPLKQLGNSKRKTGTTISEETKRRKK